eukprot:SAG11_NODE_32013_length_287_cov_0.797872_1_plen_88_part_10
MGFAGPVDSRDALDHVRKRRQRGDAVVKLPASVVRDNDAADCGFHKPMATLGTFFQCYTHLSQDISQSQRAQKAESIPFGWEAAMAAG